MYYGCSLAIPGEFMFLEWLSHRVRVVGLGGLSALPPAAGIAPAAIARIERTGGLQGVSRTNRSCLARALRVSLRDLESLEQGRIRWIDDAHVVDPPALAGSASVDLARRADHLNSSDAEAAAPRCIPADEGEGVPVVGSICNWRTVQWDNLHESMRRLNVRYPGVSTAFALRVNAGGAQLKTELPTIVFQSIPPVLLRMGERVLLTCADGTPAGVTYLGKLATDPGDVTTILLPMDDEAMRLQIQSESIVRAARWIASY